MGARREKRKVKRAASASRRKARRLGKLLAEMKSVGMSVELETGDKVAEFFKDLRPEDEGVTWGRI